MIDPLLADFIKIIKKYGDISSYEYDNLSVENKPPRRTVYRRMDLNNWERVKTIALAADSDIILGNIQLKKKVHRLEDINRVERKAFREYARVENAVIEYNEKLIEVLEKKSFTKIEQNANGAFGVLYNDRVAGMVHLSDLHFNEIVDLKFNRYDFKIAAARMKLLFYNIIKYFQCFDISNIVIAMTGDLINSDRRLDELLNNATNRSRATFLAVDILQQFIIDLRNYFNISVISVTGNESRMKDEIGLTDIVATDNYDWTVHNFLRYLFKNTDIEFAKPMDYTEAVVNIVGQNILLIHGADTINHSHIEKSITQTIGRYGINGVKIDYVILSHLHSARIGDNYARNSSLVGANDYSSKELNLPGRASQNLYIFYSNGNRDGIKVDLQNYNIDDRYDIDEELEEYNAKSAQKIKKYETIMKIVV